MARAFIFGEGQKYTTPEELAKARAVANAMLLNRETPKDVGSGLNAIGQALMYRAMMGNVDASAKANRESADAAFNPVAAALGGPGAFPPAPGSQKVSDALFGKPAGGNSYRDAIASVESAGSGDYGAIGPTHKTLGRALGRYQVMEANVGPWSKEALGREVSAEEFLRDPAIQDAVFDHRFGGYVQKYGNPQDAASAWFTGKPLAQGANRRDVLGTTGSAYVSKFNRALGNQPAVAAVNKMADGRPVQVASLDPSIGLPQPQPAAPQLPAPRTVQDRPIAAMPAAPQGNAPVQVAQAGQFDQARLPGAAGGDADTFNATNGPTLQMIAQAAANPWLNDGQANVVDMLMKQQMQRADPNYQLDRRYRETQIRNMESEIAKRNDPTARDKFGNNPVWGKDKDGKWVLFQLNNAGGLAPANAPEGIELVPPGVGQMDLGTSYGIRDRAGQVIGNVPKDVAGEAAEKEVGKSRGQAQFDLPRVVQNAERSINLLERMKSHPGRESSTGFWEGMLPARNQNQVDFQSLVDQTKGQAFLEAYNTLRGAGQITEVEGVKAENAISRLGNYRLGDDEYLRAIQDLEEVIRSGVDRARQQAGSGTMPAAPAPAAPQGGGRKTTGGLNWSIEQ